MVARDAYGFTLDYYDSHNGSPGDYTPVGSGMNHIPVMGGDFAGAILEDGLFNGNIVRMGTALLKPDETRLDVLGKAYRYDQLNRFCVDTSFLTGNLHAGNGWSGVSGSMAFYGRYSYDANGNILGLQRHNAAGTLIDDFTYAYQSKPAPASLSQYNYVGPQNRLDYVGDPATGGMDGQSAGNYAYDEIGNLVKDEAEEIAEIKWTVYGKVRAVVREAGSTKPDLDFAYTASGQRYLKVVKPKNPDGSLKNSGFWTFTYYQHDAQGNVLAVYDIKNADEECGYEMYLDQLVLYGSSRLGVLNQKLKMGTMEHSFPGYGGPGMYVCLDELVPDDDLMLGAVPATSPGEIFNQSPGGKIEAAKPWELVQNPATVKPLTVFGITNPPINVAGPAKEETKYEPGHKQYEFSNHLGNVLVTVSDMPLGVDVGNDGNVDYYMPDVKTTSDYEPFGAPLETRTLSENAAYLFGFNGQMKDDELHGEGNTYAFEYRIHDARIGRFLSVDPLHLEYPWNSTYAFAENRVIDGVDLEGLEHVYYMVTVKNDGSAILSVKKVDYWSHGITDVGTLGWGEQYYYVNEQGKPIFDNPDDNYLFIEWASPPVFFAFPEGKIYVLGKEQFDQQLLHGDGSSGGFSEPNLIAVTQFLLDMGTSGGNPIGIVLSINDLTKPTVSKKINDNSGNSSMLSVAINRRYMLEPDDMYGKNVLSLISLWNSGKNLQNLAKNGGEFGADVVQFAQTIWDGLNAGKSIYEIISGNHQDKNSENKEKTK